MGERIHADVVSTRRSNRICIQNARASLIAKAQPSLAARLLAFFGFSA